MSIIATLPEEELQLSLLGDDERGYDFVTAETIEQLRKLSFPEARVFSLYLDMTPERLKDAPWTIRYDHLTENMRAQIADKDSRKMFDVVTENIKEQVRNEYGRPQARGLALFAIPERVSFKGKHKIKYMEDETCPYCGGEMVRVTDIVNTAVTQVFGQNGRVEIVRHPDNLALMQQHGNIGAILRF
ncbi:MAG: hypothetical protein HF973_07165 [Chloroflexi bacterium]|nr:hypothetical protein [Chloroflexota bacterium]